MPNRFTLGGAAIVAPGILSQTQIGSSSVLQLLDFGTILFVGASDGGNGGGTAYRFTDYNTAKNFLRGGPVLTAIKLAVQEGRPSGIIACVAGAKTPASLNLLDIHAATAAVLTSGDQGAWTNSIGYQAQSGTQSGQAVTITYPTAAGTVVAVGGKGTAYDNVGTYLALGSIILGDGTITPPSSSGLPAIVTLTVNNPTATIVSAGLTNLAGGTGGGSQPLAFSDYKTAIDNTQQVSFDLGHLVGGYDSASQAYADGTALALEPHCNFRRWVHQVRVNGLAQTNPKATNSLALTNSAVASAQSLNSYRASLCAQQIKVFDPDTGAQVFVDAAILFCGRAAQDGSTQAWGPATPITLTRIATGIDVDYPILNADRDNAVAGGVTIFERNAVVPQPGAVRCVQSVTTQPLNAAGVPWYFGEFSVVRGSDALLAEVKATIEDSSPKALGGGNSLKTMNSVLADVHDVLEDALKKQWITEYDPSTIQIGSVEGQSDADQVQYSAAPTLPLNHLGIVQTLIPFSAQVQLVNLTTP